MAATNASGRGGNPPGGLLARLIRRLRTNWTTRQKLLIMLYGAAVWDAQRANQSETTPAANQRRPTGGRLAHRSPLSSSSRSSSPSPSSSPPPPPPPPSSSSSSPSLASSASSAALSRQSTSVRVASQWRDTAGEQPGVPPLHRFARFYFRFSTACHVVNVLLIVALKLSGDTRGKYSLACHLPRFSMLVSISQDSMVWISLAFSALHLVWRFLMKKYGPRLRFDVVAFLLTPERHVEAAPKSLKEPIELTDCQDLIYFKIDSAHSRKPAEWRCRPNRTRECRRSLSAWVDASFDAAVLVALLAFSLLFPLGLHSTIFGHRFIYAGCDDTEPALDKLVFYERAFLSTLISVLHFLDNFGALLLPTSLATVIVRDQLTYWHDIDLDIRRLIRRVPRLRLLADSIELELESCFCMCSRFQTGAIRDRNHHATGQLIEDSKLLVACKRTIASHVVELQAKLCDFFIGLDKANRFVSKLLTFALLIWLVANAVLTWTGLQTERSFDVWLVRAIQAFGMLILSVITFYVLQLKKATQSDYPSLSTIVAYDMPENKKRWILILDYYCPARRHGFTYLNGKLYSALLFFKIVSYAFSFIVLFANVRERGGLY